MSVHFIGFRGEEYHSAVRIWGLHRVWDQRARGEIADFDICVFAKYDPDKPSRFNYDDSNESLWDGWCQYLSERDPANYATAQRVSELHLAPLEC